jgi:hypothetical protein
MNCSFAPQDKILPYRASGSAHVRACPAPVAASSEHADLPAPTREQFTISANSIAPAASPNVPNACLILSTHRPHTSQLNGSPLHSAPAPFPYRSRGETARWANGESSFYAHPFLSTFQLSDEAHVQGPPEMLVDRAFGMAPTHAWTILPSSA